MPANDNGTRDRILDAAAELFITRGYTQSPLSAIAHDVGITKASLYYHFASKEAILLALISPMLDGIDALLEGTPEHFAEFDDRWTFMLDYIALLRSDPRGVAVLSRRAWSQDGAGIDQRIRHHRDRTVALATPPDADDEEKVRALLGMDMIHRELVFTADRMVLPEVTVERRQELVLVVVRRLLQPPVFAAN